MWQNKLKVTYLVSYLIKIGGKGVHIVIYFHFKFVDCKPRSIARENNKGVQLMSIKPVSDYK